MLRISVITRKFLIPLLAVMNPFTVTAAEKISFNREIRPILADNCFECHGPDEEAREGDLRLDIAEEAHASAIVPGQANKSPFVERLLTHDEKDRMPPPESPRQPTKEQIKKLITWVEQGAHYEEHWAFVAPQRADLPEVSKQDWTRNGIDRFVLAELDGRSLAPRPDTQPGILARRLNLTLTGLPVLPNRLVQFEQAYRENPDKAVSEFTDELLSSPAYGEHFAWSWLDAGRYADTNGYQADSERVMWPWRDWLIRTLNANMPFDQMTRHMLAGDLLADVEWESADWIPDADKNDLLLATGFLRNHRYDTGSGTIPDESKFENAADRLETVGTVWMGLTLQCARCHTHKFDPIEQREYYQLMSFFDKVPEFGSALKKASHPYLHVPTGEEREELLKLHQQAARATRKFRTALKNSQKAQHDWERSTDLKKDRVLRDLKFRFAETPLQFDGTNSLEKDNEPIALLRGDQEWTISFWVRPEGNETGAIFSSVEKPDGNRVGIQADWVDGKIRLRQVCRWVNSYIEFLSKDKLTPGQWHHVTFRSDGRMQGLGYRASINGDDQALTCTHPVTNDSANNTGKAPLVLGGSPLLPGFKGQLRDLRFYNRLLAPNEVTSLADARSTSELAAIPSDERSPSEQRTLQLAFLESNSLPANLARLHQERLELQQLFKVAIKATPSTMVMKEVDRGPTHLHPTGNYDSPKEVVSRGTPAFLNALDKEAPTRLDLANWLISPGHPLTARVAVNRIWQSLWGYGLVESPENFGTQCPEPIHSDLLDWLATEYQRLDWDTKALIKLIVTSRTFRQDSAAPSPLWDRDPRNRLLARGPRYRLPIQTVRDQALVLGDRLDNTLGGPPVLIDPVKGKDEKPTKLSYKENDRRRTLYTFWKRNGPHPMLAAFDVADRNQCDVRTRRTNTPLQALITLNEPGLHASAKGLAQRARESSDTESEQLAWAWLACTGKRPTPEEASHLSEVLARYRASADSEEQTWAALANVLLNLDTTLSVH